MEPKLPLEGVKVLDLTRYLAGPFCTLQLGDMGAEVIKIETPGKGDELRYTPPFLNNESTYFMLNNRNKKSLSINLKTTKGKEILHRLILKSDVLVENFRPGIMRKFGFDYQAVSEINPQLIYCSLSGYGQTGPDATKGSYDPIAQGESGVMSVNGTPEDLPTKTGVPIGDLVAALYAFQGILLALLTRQKTNQGQYIDVNMIDSLISLLSLPASGYLGTGEQVKRLGNVHPSFAPYQVLKTKDGSINICVANNILWKKLCEAAKLGKIEEDPRFATNVDRVKNREELLELLQQEFLKQNTSQWVKALTEGGVPHGEIRTINALFEEGILEQRKMLLTVNHPTVGEFRTFGQPVRMSGFERIPAMPPPLLGEHSQKILLELGYCEAEIAEMRADGIV